MVQGGTNCCQQDQHPGLTLTTLYNAVEQLRTGQPLTDKEPATNQPGLASVLLSLHQDVAVADAYGWPLALPNAELLARLVAPNHARAAEELAGTMRYLRPTKKTPRSQCFGGPMVLAERRANPRVQQLRPI